MHPNIGDVCHIQAYDDHVWVGKITEIHREFESPFLYIAGKDYRGIPQFIAKHEDELFVIDGEWWEK